MSKIQARAYYNEIDSKKAAWLRELIKRDLIAQGDVDERSITEVKPDELRSYRQCHFFAGVGIWSHALRMAGWPDDREVWTGSCPCQPFSAAGQRKGNADTRHLWPEFARLIKARAPFVVFGEQVASKDGLAWFDNVQADLDDADYTVGSVDSGAACYGAPHIRQRLYFVGTLGLADSTVVGYDRWRPSEALGGEIESQRLRDDGRLGDPSRTRLEIRGCESGHPGSERETVERAGDSGGMGHSEIYGGGPLDRESRSGIGREIPPGGSGFLGPNDRVANGTSHGCGEEHPISGGLGQGDGAQGWPTRPDAGGEPSRVADSNGGYSSPERKQRSGEHGLIPEDSGSLSGRGPVNGFWRDSNWVLTRPQRVGDLPGLRPVGPGAFPLVAGAPARVVRLRGYGDGICAPQAVEFIKAFLSLEIDEVNQ